MKKIFSFLLLSATLFGYCCPQSCDNDVNEVFSELKNKIEKGFEENINQLDSVIGKYEDLIKTQKTSAFLLSKYETQLKAEYLEIKKNLFYINKYMKIKAIK